MKIMYCEYDFTKLAHVFKANIIRIADPKLSWIELIDLLDRWDSWDYHELVELDYFVDVLNRVDTFLENFLTQWKYLCIVMDSPIEHKSYTPNELMEYDTDLKQLRIVLRFTHMLLSNTVEQSIYNSIEFVEQLVCSYDDNISFLALDVLTSLAIPPFAHRCAHDIAQHVTGLHKTAKYCRSMFTIVNAAKDVKLDSYASIQSPSSTIGTVVALDLSVLSPEGEIISVDLPEYANFRSNVSIQEILDVTVDQRCAYDILNDESLNIPTTLRTTCLWSLRLVRYFQRGDSKLMYYECCYRAILVILSCFQDVYSLTTFFQDKHEFLQDFIYIINNGIDRPELSSLCNISSHCIQSLFASEDIVDAGLMGKLTTLQQSLGLNRGHFMGILPSLLRASVAQLQSANHDASMIEDHKLLWIENIFLLTITVLEYHETGQFLPENGLLSCLIDICKINNVRNRSKLWLHVESIVVITTDTCISGGNVINSFVRQDGVDIIMTKLQHEIDEILKLVSSQSTNLVLATPTKTPMTPLAPIVIDIDIIPPQLYGLLSLHRLIIHDILSLLHIILEKGLQDTVEHRITQIFKSTQFADSLLQIYDHVTVFSTAAIDMIDSLISNMINFDPSTPAMLNHFLNNGIIRKILNLFVNDSFLLSSLSTYAVPFSEGFLRDHVNLFFFVALTTQGLELLQEVNPFPALMNIYTSEKFAFPNCKLLTMNLSRAMATSLEEISRHYPSLSEGILSALVLTLKQLQSRANEYLSRDILTMEPEYLSILNSISCALVALNIFISRSSTLKEFLDKYDGVKLICSFFRIGLGPSRYFLVNLGCAVSSTAHFIGSTPLISAVANCINQISRAEPKVYLDGIVPIMEYELDTLALSLHNYRMEFDEEYKSTRTAGEGEQLTAGNWRQSGIELKDVLISVSNLLLHEEGGVTSSSSASSSEGVLSGKLQSFATVIKSLVILSYYLNTLFPPSSKPTPFSVVDPFLEYEELYSVISVFLSSLFISAQFEISRHTQSTMFSSSKYEDMNLAKTKRKTHPVYKLLVTSDKGVWVRSPTELSSVSDGENSQSNSMKKLYEIPKGYIIEAYERKQVGNRMLMYRVANGWINSYKRSSSSLEPLVEVIDIVPKTQSQIDEDTKYYQLYPSLNSNFSDLENRTIGDITASRAGYLCLFHLSYSIRTMMEAISRNVQNSLFPSSPLSVNTVKQSMCTRNFKLLLTTMENLGDRLNSLSPNGVLALNTWSNASDPKLWKPQFQIPLTLDQCNISFIYLTLTATEIFGDLFSSKNVSMKNVNAHVVWLIEMLQHHSLLLEQLIQASLLVFLCCFHGSTSTNCSESRPISSEGSMITDEHYMSILQDRQKFSLESCSVLTDFWNGLFGFLNISTADTIFSKQYPQFDIPTFRHSLCCIVSRTIFSNIVGQPQLLQQLPASFVKQVLDLGLNSSQCLASAWYPGQQPPFYSMLGESLPDPYRTRLPPLPKSSETATSTSAVPSTSSDNSYTLSPLPSNYSDENGDNIFKSIRKEDLKSYVTNSLCYCCMYLLENGLDNNDAIELLSLEMMDENRLYTRDILVISLLNSLSACLDSTIIVNLDLKVTVMAWLFERCIQIINEDILPNLPTATTSDFYGKSYQKLFGLLHAINILFYGKLARFAQNLSNKLFDQLLWCTIFFTRDERYNILFTSLISLLEELVTKFHIEQAPEKFLPEWIAPAVLLLDICSQNILFHRGLVGDFVRNSRTKQIIGLPISSISASPDIEYITPNFVQSLQSMGVQTEEEPQSQKASRRSKSGKNKSTSDKGDTTESSEIKTPPPAPIPVPVPEVVSSVVKSFQFPFLESPLTTSHKSSLITTCAKLLQLQTSLAAIGTMDDSSSSKHEQRIVVTHSILQILTHLAPATGHQQQICESLFAIRTPYPGISSVISTLIQRQFETQDLLEQTIAYDLKYCFFKLLKRNPSFHRDSANKVPLDQLVDAVLPMICRSQNVFFSVLQKYCKFSVSITNGRKMDVEWVGATDVSPPPQECETGQKRKNESIVVESESASKRQRVDSSSEIAIHEKSPNPSTSMMQSVVEFLLRKIASQYDICVGIRDKTLDDVSSNPGLSVSDLLSILADLVATVSGVATIVHRFHFIDHTDRKVCFKNYDLAIAGKPSQTNRHSYFLSFLIHVLLLGDQDLHKSTTKDASNSKEDLYHQILGTAVRDNAAYLLACLISRPGDGRKRVIFEIMCCLRGVDAIQSPITTTLQLRQLITLTETICCLLSPPARWKLKETIVVPHLDVLYMLTKSDAISILTSVLCSIHIDHPLALEAITKLSTLLDVFLKRGMDFVEKIHAQKLKTSSTTEQSKNSVATTTTTPSINTPHPTADINFANTQLEDLFSTVHPMDTPIRPSGRDGDSNAQDRHGSGDWPDAVTAMIDVNGHGHDDEESDGSEESVVELGSDDGGDDDEDDDDEDEVVYEGRGFDGGIDIDDDDSDDSDEDGEHVQAVEDDERLLQAVNAEDEEGSDHDGDDDDGEMDEMEEVGSQDHHDDDDDEDGDESDMDYDNFDFRTADGIDVTQANISHLSNEQDESNMGHEGNSHSSASDNEEVDFDGQDDFHVSGGVESSGDRNGYFNGAEVVDGADSDIDIEVNLERDEDGESGLQLLGDDLANEVYDTHHHRPSTSRIDISPSIVFASNGNRRTGMIGNMELNFGIPNATRTLGNPIRFSLNIDAGGAPIANNPMHRADFVRLIRDIAYQGLATVSAGNVPVPTGRRRSNSHSLPRSNRTLTASSQVDDEDSEVGHRGRGGPGSASRMRSAPDEDFVTGIGSMLDSIAVASQNASGGRHATRGAYVIRDGIDSGTRRSFGGGTGLAPRVSAASQNDFWAAMDTSHQPSNAATVGIGSAFTSQLPPNSTTNLLLQELANRPIVNPLIACIDVARISRGYHAGLRARIAESNSRYPDGLSTFTVGSHIFGSVIPTIVSPPSQGIGSNTTIYNYSNSASVNVFGFYPSTSQPINQSNDLISSNIRSYIRVPRHSASTIRRSMGAIVSDRRWGNDVGNIQLMADHSNDLAEILQDGLEAFYSLDTGGGGAPDSSSRRLFSRNSRSVPSREFLRWDELFANSEVPPGERSFSLSRRIPTLASSHRGGIHHLGRLENIDGAIPMGRFGGDLHNFLANAAATMGMSEDDEDDDEMDDDEEEEDHDEGEDGENNNNSESAVASQTVDGGGDGDPEDPDHDHDGDDDEDGDGDDEDEDGEDDDSEPMEGSDGEEHHSDNDDNHDGDEDGGEEGDEDGDEDNEDEDPAMDDDADDVQPENPVPEPSRPSAIRIIPPPDVDEEVWQSLPLEVQMEMGQAAPMDIPEVVEASATTAGTDVANDTNGLSQENIDFVNSLSYELRQDVLLSVDDAFLASLRPSMRIEAQQLREAHGIYTPVVPSFGLTAAATEAPARVAAAEPTATVTTTSSNNNAEAIAAVPTGAAVSPQKEAVTNDETMYVLVPNDHTLPVSFTHYGFSFSKDGTSLFYRLLKCLLSLSGKAKCPRALTKLLADLCLYGAEFCRPRVLESLFHALLADTDAMLKPLLSIPASDQSASFELDTQYLRVHAAQLVSHPLTIRRVISAISHLVRKTNKIVWRDILQRPADENGFWLFGALLRMLNPTNDKLLMILQKQQGNTTPSTLIQGNMDSLLHLIEEIVAPLSRITVAQANRLMELQSASNASTQPIEEVMTEIPTEGGDSERPKKKIRFSEAGGVTEVASPDYEALHTLATEIIATTGAAANTKIPLPFPRLSKEETSILSHFISSDCIASNRKRLLKILRVLSLTDINWNLLLLDLATMITNMSGIVSNELEIFLESLRSTKRFPVNDAEYSDTLYHQASDRMLFCLETMTLLRSRSTAQSAKESAHVSEIMRKNIQFHNSWMKLFECLDHVREVEGLIYQDSEEDSEAVVTATTSTTNNNSSRTVSTPRHSRRHSVGHTNAGHAVVRTNSNTSSSNSNTNAHDASNANNMTQRETQQLQENRPVSSLSIQTMRFFPLIEAFLLVCNSSMLHRENLAEYQLSAVTPTTSFTGIQLGSPEVNVPGHRFRQSQAYFSMHIDVSSHAYQHILAEDDVTRSLLSQLLTFVDKNRLLLNIMLKGNVQLLETSFAPVMCIQKCRHLLHFDIKRSYFRMKLKKLKTQAVRSSSGASHGHLHVKVRREDIFVDSFRSLRYKTADELKKKLSVEFSNEEGMDAGGLTREWFSVLAKEIFNANYALFNGINDNAVCFQPNPNSYVNPEHLSYFKFVGRVIGKAIFDNHLFDAHFTRSFYKHILGIPVTLQDLESIEPSYYNSLKHIIEHPLELLGLDDLTFTAETNNFGKIENVDLIEGGSKITVTDENKIDYVRLLANHRMTTAIRKQIDAFLEGFHELIPAELISIFDPQELELLISGLPDIDLDDLRAHTEYQGGFKATDIPIHNFWNVLKSFSKEEKALFLQFVTGTSKVPLDGFKALRGSDGVRWFNIHKAYGGKHLLPSAHTCFNQLDLPEYETEEELKEKLLLAIREGSEGFGFA